MSGKKPRVSVAVPVFNGDNLRGRGARIRFSRKPTGILKSSFPTTARPTAPRKFAAAIAERDSRVHYYRSDVNRGVYWNFRRGLELAQGEYFMWLAHDDKLAPEFLERCVAALDA